MDISLNPSRKMGRELLNACYFGNDLLALKLIKSGANIHYFDPRDGWTSCHYAARWGKVKLLNLLCSAGADVNVRTFERETPLHVASRANRKDTCVWLLSNKCDPNVLNVNGNRASELTIEDEIKYLCDNFEDFKKRVIEIRRISKEKEQNEKKDKK